MSGTRESGSQDVAYELLTIIYFFWGNDGKNGNPRSSPFSWFCQSSILCLCFSLCTVKIFIFLFYTKGIQLFDHKIIENVLSCSQNTELLFAKSQFIASKLWWHALLSATGPVQKLNAPAMPQLFTANGTIALYPFPLRIIRVNLYMFSRRIFLTWLV